MHANFLEKYICVFSYITVYILIIRVSILIQQVTLPDINHVYYISCRLSLHFILLSSHAFVYQEIGFTHKMIFKNFFNVDPHRHVFRIRY